MLILLHPVHILYYVDIAAATELTGCCVYINACMCWLRILRPISPRRNGTQPLWPWTSFARALNIFTLFFFYIPFTYCNIICDIGSYPEYASVCSREFVRFSAAFACWRYFRVYRFFTGVCFRTHPSLRLFFLLLFNNILYINRCKGKF